MRSLFLRIFLWFWLAMVVIVGFLVVSSPYWTRVRPEVARWEQQGFARLSDASAHAAEILEQEGPDALGRGRRTGDRRGPQRSFVFDQDGSEVSGREPTPGATELAAASRASGEIEMTREGFHFLLARPATSVDGEALTVVVVGGQGRHGPGGRPPRPVEILDAKVLVPRLAVIVLVVGGLCYWLSRYLTSPLRKLRGATRALADGDLSARVGASVGSRRDEIGELGRDFDGMAERVQHLVEAQQRLLRDVSHELRSPLARLEVALEMARDGSAGEQTEYLDRIGLESKRINELIGHLLTLNRLESGSEELSREPVDLVALLGEVVRDAGFEAASKDCSVELNAPETSEVEGLPGLLRSAFENVIRNAVRYTAKQSEVEVELITTGGRTTVGVLDRGPGVPEDDLESIFQPFFRVADDRDRASGGVGLGLAITERAARLHGGSVTARNRDGGGLEVKITLPVG